MIELQFSEHTRTWVNYIHELQTRICLALETIDGKATFSEEHWERPAGGNGRTRVIQSGAVFEKGGVNTSVVFGPVTDEMRMQLRIDGDGWFAAGLSLVIHPYNPYVPTVHCNYRMFEMYNSQGIAVDRWFGGGTDLTPYYLFEDDVKHFHQILKNVCDDFDTSFYPSFKRNCDDYFVNWHRNAERRGVGGIFYDHQRPMGNRETDWWINFAMRCGDAFSEGYIPIVARRKDMAFGEKEKYWQEIRRGRYTEFNLIHDRGTLFGLKTNGRIESIFMSLPPTVRFDYNYQPLPGSPEEALLQACQHPVNWLNA
ncbi:MAG TPA: oxygen-dependent coproporphyrinogen oxidase [Flavihumibacter sp.]|nr:oxygen-dependent coproporphyrinogen oxidase [Bacteroidota bacterium]HOA37024.1 oxygen-dependent coproporphyrinogen oxidase [Flavihumibacter sp.]HPZ88472.1 oxygen-dependent coproporphyrinogen oxidase [Flavihumibacter sp.]HQD08341.1 oxygen-dependent coproporphyrinogen oxidase [Flavihumibacter sp.]